MEVTIRQLSKTWLCAGLLTSDKKNNPGAYVKSADRVYKHIYGVPGEKLMTRLYNAKGPVDFVGILNNTVGYNSFRLLVETKEYSDVIRELIEMQERSRKIESNYKARMRKYKKLKKKAAKQRAIISASSTTDVQKKEASEKLRDIERDIAQYNKKFKKESKESNKIYNLYKKTLKVLRNVTGIQKVKKTKTSTSACKNLIKRATDPFESMGYDDLWGSRFFSQASNGSIPDINDYWTDDGLDVDAYNKAVYSSNSRPSNKHLNDKVTIADNPNYGASQRFGDKQASHSFQQNDSDAAKLEAENRYLRQQLAKYQNQDDDEEDEDSDPSFQRGLTPEELVANSRDYDDVLAEINSADQSKIVKPAPAQVQDDEDEDDDFDEDMDNMKQAILNLADNQNKIAGALSEIGNSLESINKRINTLEGNPLIEENGEPAPQKVVAEVKENKKVPLEPVDVAEDQPNTLMKRSSDDPEIKAHAEEVKKMLPMLDLDPETHKPYKPSHVIAARVSNPQIEEKLVQFRKLLRLQKNTEASKLNKEIEKMKSEEAAKQNAELDRQYEEALANWKKEYLQYQ
nr:MAG TPA: hypothetical protein [Caudoviricetes sp.]